MQPPVNQATSNEPIYTFVRYATQSGRREERRDERRREREGEGERKR